ncbi:MAG: sulfatase-like hydrolase/transferase [Angelakisella sp.]
MKDKNILLIITDQLTWRALPAYGNSFVKTPNIDRIAKNSVRLEQCYTPCPLCQPARAAFWSGRYPHQIDVLSNGRNWPVSQLPETIPTLGETFRNAGYETVHFGKTHDAGTLRGFTVEPEKELPVEPASPAFPLNFDTFNDRYATVRAVEFLSGYHWKKPLCMVADLVNPHNICGWVGKNAGIHEDIPTGEPLPPLPENFDFEDIQNRPLPVQYICCSHNRQAEASGWTPRNYQHYLAAYYHYLTLVDREIGLILDALEATGQWDNTLLVFMADHGDSMVARGRVTKQVDFYEEVTRVPMIFHGPGVTPRQDAVPGLASLLDLFPTLCGYAGIPVPAGLPGVDISGVLQTGQLPARRYVVSQWHTEWGFTVSPGRMLCSGQYKYMRYLEGDSRELYDLAADPFEKTNVAQNAAYAAVVAQMEALLLQYLSQEQDPFLQMAWRADHRWRSHTLGYHQHTGPAAPMVK